MKQSAQFCPLGGLLQYFAQELYRRIIYRIDKESCILTICGLPRTTETVYPSNRTPWLLHKSWHETKNGQNLYSQNYIRCIFGPVREILAYQIRIFLIFMMIHPLVPRPNFRSVKIQFTRVIF